MTCGTSGFGSRYEHQLSLFDNATAADFEDNSVLRSSFCFQHGLQAVVVDFRRVRDAFQMRSFLAMLPFAHIVIPIIWMAGFVHY